MTGELLALAERCEQATGPSLELDNALRDLAGEPRTALSKSTPYYTASIDSALTLVPEGWEKIDTSSLRYTDGSLRHYAAINFMQPSKAATPALALCAAALRARAATD